MKRYKKYFHFLFLLILFSQAVPVSAKDYKGAEYRTKASYLYGRFEVRMKSAYREGMLTSFFTYYDGGGDWNEIDIEILGRYPNDIQFNAITPGQVNHVGHYPMSSSPHSDYHVYAFEWTPQYVAWFVDGNEVLKQTGTHILSLTQPQKLMMNIWNPVYENWAGKFNPNALPAFAYYDWVKYYEYTPGTGNYGTGNNFTLQWSDDFNSWNTSFWDKATHTWNGNGCDFIYDNAVFRDGNLVLCLTNSLNTGYVDVKPPVLLWARASENKVLVTFSEELDQAAAENISNYVIQNVTINSAALRADLKSVILSVTGLDLTTYKNIVVLSMKDRAPVPNTSGAMAAQIVMPVAPVFPYKINCGGSSALGYLPDKEWSNDSEYGFLDGSITTYSSTLQINGTDEDAIYQSERYGLVNYHIRVPDGTYKVKLMFAENYFNAAGKRIFDVYCQGSRIIENLDIFSYVGKNAAYERQFENIEVTNEEIEIYFAAKVDNPLINGVVITPVSSGNIDEGSLNNPDFRLGQNYPNPFNGSTVINYYLSMPEDISLRIYNIIGEQIFFKDLGRKEAGTHEFILNEHELKDPLSSSVYFYTLQSPKHRETRKMVLLN